MTKVQPTDAESPLASGVWDIDPTHSNVEFVVRHLRSRLRGRFGEFNGTIEVGADLADCAAQVTIRSASLNTYLDVRDEGLRGSDYLNVRRFPTITFRSTRVHDLEGECAFSLDGHLSIRDRTRPVSLRVEYLGCGRDAWGACRAGFSARTTINRDDFGVMGNAVLETGALLVGKHVQVELEVEAILRADPKRLATLGCASA